MTYFELLKKFTQHSGDLMDAVKDLPEIQGVGNKRHLLTSIHQLNLDINSKFVELNSIKDDLRKIIVFLRRIPFKNFYAENDISELDYIKYHLEVFFHKVSTGSDLLKLLVNVLFDLQIENRKCNIPNLRKKIPTKYDKSFLQLIEAYDDTFKGVKYFRNKNSHEAKFYDEEHSNLDLYDNLYRQSKKFELETDSLRFIMPECVLEFRTKEFRKDKIRWIQDALVSYETYTNKIIENAIWVYFHKYKEWLEKT